MKRWQFYADARTAELRAALSTPATFAGLQLHWAHNAEVWKQKRPTIYEHLAWPATWTWNGTPITRSHARSISAWGGWRVSGD